METSYIKLPPHLKKTKSIVNIQNKDNKCFLWSVLVHLHRAKNKYKFRVSNYIPYEDDFSEVSFPIQISQVKIFERKNKLSINVFGLDKDGKIVPVTLSKTDYEVKINLMMISKEENNHYCLITNFNGLMLGRTKRTSTMYYCFNCLHGFIRQDLLDKHKQDCMKNQTQRLSFLEDDLEVKFSFGYVVVCAVPHLTAPLVIYRCENVIEVFFEKLREEKKRICTILRNPKPLKMTNEDDQKFPDATTCSICGEELSAQRVRDHDHVSGAFRGAAHNSCNLQYRLLRRKNKEGGDSYIIPVIFHNLCSYDGHHIMEKRGTYKQKQVTLIPNTLEKYISFSLGNPRFIDSLQFMGMSLEKLVGNLAQESKHKFENMCKYILNADQQDLLLRKGVYPYDYVDEPSKLE